MKKTRASASSPFLSPFLSPFGDGFGMGGVSPAAATYLLRTLFSDVVTQPTTLVNGQEINEDQDGMPLVADKVAADDYNLTTVISGTGSITANSTSGKLVFTETADLAVNARTQIQYDNAITIVDGLTVFAGGFSNSKVGGAVSRYAHLATIETSAWANYILTSLQESATQNLFLYLDDTGTTVSIPISDVSQDHDIYQIFDKTNNLVFCFLKEPAGTLNLMYIGSKTIPTSMYPRIQVQKTGGAVEKFKCDPDTLNTAAITPLYEDGFDTDWSGSGWTTSASLATVTSADSATYYLTRTGQADVFIVANVWMEYIGGNISSTRLQCRHDGTATAANGIHLVVVSFAATPDTFGIQVSGVTVASGNTGGDITTGAYYEMKLWAVGNTCGGTLNGGTVTYTDASVGALTETNITLSGISITSPAANARCNSHKTYNASGVTINV